MWGLLGYEEQKKEEEPEPFIDDTDYQSIARARLVAEEGSALPPLADLYDKDDNKDEQVANFMQQYTILLEFQRLHDLLPLGMYLSPSHASILTWHGTLFLRSGPYRGGIFKFQIDLPEEYPDSPPTLNFISDVFHPLVDPENGRVDLDIWFLDWKPGSDYAACVLPRLHKAFVHREHLLGPSDAIEPMNPEARDLLKHDPAKFDERAKECVAKSNSDEACFENPEGSLLRFAQGPTENHDDLLKALRETGTIGCTFDDRKCMFVEWFCDYYVRNRILKPKKKKKKHKAQLNIGSKERRPTMKDTDALKGFAAEMNEEDDDEEEEDEE